MSVYVLLAATLLVFLNVIRMHRKRGKRARAILPGIVYDSGVRSPWRTPGRRGPHRGY